MEENGMKEWEYDDEEMSNNNIYDDKGIRGNMILRLGKKVVIAGVVMSSLPVVVPPLIVMSALGCAVSLPFGLVLASYAATDELMSRLLGRDYNIAIDEYDDYTEEDDEEEEEEEERIVEMTTIEIPNNGVAVAAQLITVDDNESQDKKFSQASNIISNEEDQNINYDEVMGENKGDYQNAQLLEQTSLEFERTPISQNKKDSQASNISNEAETKRKRRQGKRNNNNKTSKSATKRTETDDDKKSGLVFSTGNIESSIKTERKLQDTKEKDVSVRDASNVMNDEISTSEIAIDVPLKDGGNGNQSETIASVVELKNDKGIMELKEEKDASALDSASHSSEEGLLGEEVIWKKMNAIRAIVGYKAPKRDSYVEELKALYLFTGIEPPSDSAEFHHKLSFLMSVIGLK
ncbi:hypothetical protein STAS_00690 [Striga asiatica]|uniref:Uncharacterized protein n=1 Tax=Striga asiatica TaxID=4170 RepID=A0A5A7NXA7_STRAF|nr:hypothetical protein STAS_00690 [Striga asiatica]